LGDNSTTSRLTPVLVCGGLTFTSISAGNIFSLGVTNTGVAYGWGRNAEGQLGDNSTTSRLTPVQVCVL
jgi:alpha-tubulin suppressor-like RCC1 family protein